MEDLGKRKEFVGNETKGDNNNKKKIKNERTPDSPMRELKRDPSTIYGAFLSLTLDGGIGGTLGGGEGNGYIIIFIAIIRYNNRIFH